MMKKPLHLYSLILLLSTTFIPSLQAQEKCFGASRINADRSVTFIYNDPAAKEVTLFCDCELEKETTEILSEDYNKVKMHKDSNGVWTYTTPPMAPEVYTYQIQADKRRFPDPSNPDSIRVHDERRSVFIIAGTPQTDLYLCEKLRGRVDTLSFRRDTTEKSRTVLVYLPPQYQQNGQQMPVLYLLHGLNGSETAWNDRGMAVQIVDNLIAQHKIIPVILVLPDVNPERLISQDEQNIGLLENVLCFPSWNKMEFEQCYPEMDRYLSDIYHFSTKAGSRSAAGLSAGAKQAANLANMYDSTFAAVGMFSPVINHKQYPENHFTYYWVAGGKSDFFYSSISHYCNVLKRKEVPHTAYLTTGGHTWRNWRIYLTAFLLERYDIQHSESQYSK